MHALTYATALVLAVVYVAGVRHISRRRSWPLWRTALFFTGLIALLGALVSPIDRIAHDLFSVHMVQHMLLTVASAPLLLLGAPVRPLLHGIPASIRRAVVRPLAGSHAVRAVVHFIRLPLIAIGIYVVGLYVWHVPSFYGAALASAELHALEHLFFFGSALLFWSVIIDPEPFRATLPYPARIAALLLAGAAQNTILGGLLSFSSRLLYTHYEGRTDAYGISALTDQRLGGAIMWVPGDVIFLIAASFAFFLWLAREDADQRLVEARASRGR